jgi:N-acyl homoserine lactone hydrolase
MTRPSRVYLLQQYAREVSIPSGSLYMSSGCYLVQTDDGRNLMIDSGMPADKASGPFAEESPPILAQLGAIGVRPADVDTVICTHYDIDHVGLHDRFTNAEHVVQREHHDAAAGGAERFAGGRSHWDAPGLRRRLVEGDVELFPGLRLLETSGHAPGHQSVLLALPATGAVLLTADAVPLESLFSMDRVAQRYEDRDRLLSSTRKLLDLVANDGVALTVFHHDGEQWKKLRRAPEFYE